MKERPILFSAPMVRAILEGRKTQTRRVVKPQPVMEEGHWAYWKSGVRTTPFWKNPNGDVVWPSEKEVIEKFIGCPYGRPGDRLWVRETWCRHRDEWSLVPAGFAATDDPSTVAQVGECKVEGVPRWRPSIHLPRWASRIDLEVTEVRVERLQDITTEDARAEGMESDEYLEFMDWATSVAPRDFPCEFPTLRGEFEKIWTKINGVASWAANPWVWVVSFRKVV